MDRVSPHKLRTMHASLHRALKETDLIHEEGAGTTTKARGERSQVPRDGVRPATGRANASARCEPPRGSLRGGKGPFPHECGGATSNCLGVPATSQSSLRRQGAHHKSAFVTPSKNGWRDLTPTSSMQPARSGGPPDDAGGHAGVWRQLRFEDVGSASASTPQLLRVLSPKLSHHSLGSSGGSSSDAGRRPAYASTPQLLRVLSPMMSHHSLCSSGSGPLTTPTPRVRALKPSTSTLNVSQLSFRMDDDAERCEVAARKRVNVLRHARRLYPGEGDGDVDDDDERKLALDASMCSSRTLHFSLCHDDDYPPIQTDIEGMYEFEDPRWHGSPGLGSARPSSASPQRLTPASSTRRPWGPAASDSAARRPRLGFGQTPPHAEAPGTKHSDFGPPTQIAAATAGTAARDCSGPAGLLQLRLGPREGTGGDARNVTASAPSPSSQQARRRAWQSLEDAGTPCDRGGHFCTRRGHSAGAPGSAFSGGSTCSCVAGQSARHGCGRGCDSGHGDGVLGLRGAAAVNSGVGAAVQESPPRGANRSAFNAWDAGAAPKAGAPEHKAPLQGRPLVRAARQDGACEACNGGPGVQGDRSCHVCGRHGDGLASRPTMPESDCSSRRAGEPGSVRGPDKEGVPQRPGPSENEATPAAASRALGSSAGNAAGPSTAAQDAAGREVNAPKNRSSGFSLDLSALAEGRGDGSTLGDTGEDVPPRSLRERVAMLEAKLGMHALTPRESFATPEVVQRLKWSPLSARGPGVGEAPAAATVVEVDEDSDGSSPSEDGRSASAGGWAGIRRSSRSGALASSAGDTTPSEQDPSSSGSSSPAVEATPLKATPLKHRAAIIEELLNQSGCSPAGGGPLGQVARSYVAVRATPPWTLRGSGGKAGAAGAVCSGGGGGFGDGSNGSGTTGSSGNGSSAGNVTIGVQVGSGCGIAMEGTAGGKPCPEVTREACGVGTLGGKGVVGDGGVAGDAGAKDTCTLSVQGCAGKACTPSTSPDLHAAGTGSRCDYCACKRDCASRSGGVCQGCPCTCGLTNDSTSSGAGGGGQPGGGTGGKGGKTGEAKKPPAAPPPPPKGKGPKGKAKGKGKAPKGGASAAPPVPRKADVKPRVPMKRLFWSAFILEDAKMAPPDATAWAAIHIEESLQRFDVDELERMFGEKDLPKVFLRAECSPGKAKPRVRVFDETRRRQVCVMLARLPPVDVTLEAVLEMNDGRLNRDQVELLLASAPPPEELAALRAAAAEMDGEGDEAPLWDDAEAFVVRLSAVPLFALRLQIWVFENAFDERFEFMQSAATEVRKACACLRSSRRVHRLLGLSLYVGNYLNGGTNRGRADGFTVDALSMMRTVKSQQQPVRTLVDYVVGQIDRMHPADLEGLFAEGGEAWVVRRAARHKLADVALELAAWCAQADGLVKRAASSEDDVLGARGLRVKLKLQEFGALQRLLNDTDGEYRALCAWFHEGATKVARPSDEFFGIWDGFLQAVRVAVDRISVERRANERKAFGRKRAPPTKARRPLQKVRQSLHPEDGASQAAARSRELAKSAGSEPAGKIFHPASRSARAGA